MHMLMFFVINAESPLEADILLTASAENTCISLISTKPSYYNEVMGNKSVCCCFY